MPESSRTTKDSNEDSALRIFREAGGILRTRDALQKSIHPRTLYALRDSGQLEELSRGLYRLADAAPLDEPDLVTVSLKIRRAVVCLISALARHELTTQIPHEVHVAIPRGSEPPRLSYPPVRHYWFGPSAYSAGIETIDLDGVEVKIYNREKTLADCFKYRNRIGLDVVVEALRMYRQQGQIKVESLLHFAGVCRVRKVMTPYLESIL